VERRIVKVMPREYRRALAEQAKRERSVRQGVAGSPVAVPVVAAAPPTQKHPAGGWKAPDTAGPENRTRPTHRINRGR
jgi:hypothetical protein